MAARLYLIIYDVRCRKRWRRLYRALRRVGAWAQLSAFFCRLPPAGAKALERDLRGLVDPTEDRLVIADLGPAEQASLTIIGEVEVPTPPKARIL